VEEHHYLVHPSLLEDQLPEQRVYLEEDRNQQERHQLLAVLDQVAEYLAPSRLEVYRLVEQVRLVEVYLERSLQEAQVH
jgi:hypothetical protein